VTAAARGTRFEAQPAAGRPLRRARAAARGLALVEVIVATGVLAAIAMLVYGAFAGMRSSKEGVARLAERHHEGREALRRIARELSSAFVSLHRPLDPNAQTMTTVFVGERGSPASRLDFASFSHRRLDRDAHESDQAEISYYGSADPKRSGVVDLVRRSTPRLDLDPARGGRVDVLATDIESFELEYLDPMTGLWSETWDTTDATGQLDRLPLQVKVTLVLEGGRRRALGGSFETLRFVTKVAIPIQKALTFAVE